MGVANSKGTSLKGIAFMGEPPNTNLIIATVALLLGATSCQSEFEFYLNSSENQLDGSTGGTNGGTTGSTNGGCNGGNSPP
jgi:hypothetical protein